MCQLIFELFHSSSSLTIVVIPKAFLEISDFQISLDFAKKCVEAVCNQAHPTSTPDAFYFNFATKDKQETVVDVRGVEIPGRGDQAGGNR